MNKPLVSVIIVSYNTRKLTAKSINSVFNSIGFSSGEIEVILVDNNSTDDTVEYVKKTFPKVKLIANSKNRGFGGGNNQGVKIATGKYILLLNTDAFLGEDSLKIMVGIMEKERGIISVGPQLKYVDGSLQQSAGYMPTPLRVFAWMLWLDKLPLIKKIFSKPYHIYDLSWYESDHNPGWLMGACVLFRKKDFESVGGFDEEIFMYAEEVELYRRLKSKFNGIVHFTTHTSVVHIGSASTKKANAYRLVHELKGIEYIYKKHYPLFKIPVKITLTIGALLRLILYRLIPGRKEAYEEYKKYFQKN